MLGKLRRTARLALGNANRLIQSSGSNKADQELSASYQYVSRLGHNSANVWIRRSSNIPGWLFQDEHEFIYQQALSAPPGDFVEIGVLFGKSTSILAGAVQDRGGLEKIFAFDPFTLAGSDHDRHVHQVTHGLKNTFEEYVRYAVELGFYEQVIPIATFSNLSLPFTKLSVSFVFLDGCHEKEAVEIDFSLLQPKLIPGAIILFHDATNPAFPGIQEAIQSILSQSSQFQECGRAGTIVAIRHCC